MSFFVRRLPQERLMVGALSLVGLHHFLSGTVSLVTLAGGWTPAAALVVTPEWGGCDFFVNFFGIWQPILTVAFLSLVMCGTWQCNAAHALLQLRRSSILINVHLLECNINYV